MHHVDFSGMPFEPCAPGVRHKVHATGGRWLRLVEYARDMPPHWCERGHLGQVLHGEMQIEFDDETRVFRAGDGVDIPSGSAHRHRATVLTPTVLALFVEDAP